tara:strand:- start:1139 stop:1816 length:678 start_codon:yes stop_codon:yes gene_type:complete
MRNQQQKKAVAKEAIDFIVKDEVIGVGTGSTVNFFIDELGKIKDCLKGAVTTSIESRNRLIDHGITVYELNDIEFLPIYIDGADEINNNGVMIKGGGGALTKEKIVANFANDFICIVDESKFVNNLGTFPLPIEVVPMAEKSVCKSLIRMGGIPVTRKKEGKVFFTENSCIILDVKHIQLTNPNEVEFKINMIPGVVNVGLFSYNSASICLVGTNKGVIKKNFKR